MKKVEKVKKVVKTKAVLVKELEQAVKVDKGFLNSLERANAETIKRLIEICSQQSTRESGYFFAKKS